MKASEAVNAVKTWWTNNPAWHGAVEYVAVFFIGVIVGKLL